MTSETWHIEAHPDGDWLLFEVRSGPNERDRLIAEGLTEADAKRIIADHNLAQWAREHGQPALIRHGTALAREALAAYPSAAEGE